MEIWSDVSSSEGPVHQIYILPSSSLLFFLLLSYCYIHTIASISAWGGGVTVPTPLVQFPIIIGYSDSDYNWWSFRRMRRGRGIMRRCTMRPMRMGEFIRTFRPIAPLHSWRRGVTRRLLVSISPITLIRFPMHPNCLNHQSREEEKEGHRPVSLSSSFPVKPIVDSLRITESFNEIHPDCLSPLLLLPVSCLMHPRKATHLD